MNNYEREMKWRDDIHENVVHAAAGRLEIRVLRSNLATIEYFQGLENSWKNDKWREENMYDIEDKSCIQTITYGYSSYLHPSPGYGDELPAYGTPELAGVPGEGGHDSIQALQADGVGAGEELRSVLAAIVHA